MRTADRIDKMLDEALEMTFPASDPFTIYIPEANAAEDGVLDPEIEGVFPIAA